MFLNNKLSKSEAVYRALDTSQAMIEFSPQGIILEANANFLNVIGYSLSEIKGLHHSIFCDPAYVASDEYKQFWSDLRVGQFKSDEFKRFCKSSEPVWLQATYNPLKDRQGRITGIIKVASDITKAKTKSLDDFSKINAIYKSQAVIEFTPMGEIITANDIFLKTIGYNLSEIAQKPHSMLCEPEFVKSKAYSDLWSNLRSGLVMHGEFKRLGRGGKVVYIQAAYNPIFDDTGKVVKVLKFGANITELVEKRIRNEDLAHNLNQEMTGVIKQINEANNMAANASGASAVTSDMVSSVAAASEELSKSVQHIAQNMESASQNVQDVSSVAEVTNRSAVSLDESASAMNNVIALIQDIASQINLLALNATIESARAGDAGKGFAVVASEVKSLANQVSNSTKTISTEIDRMQNVTHQVVEGLAKISNNMGSVMTNVHEVSAAMNQQISATGEISKNMQSAVSSVTQITTSLQHISNTFDQVNSSSEQVKVSIETLVA